MKVYTKKGDSGTTQLIGGRRVPKSSLKIEAYGTVDELNSYLGLLRDQGLDDKKKQQLIAIQNNLFVIGSLLAMDLNAKMQLPQLPSNASLDLENWIDEMDESLEPMRNFVLPGGDQSVSICHVSRCVCRRAERIIVDLNTEEKVDEAILTYMNRLSDYLFVLSRKIAADKGVNEVPWIPSK